ncbi:hypothetical protein DUI87_19977 [Hirundo rustica rustica]|uniref:Ataxin-10 domain-containing protein n=1 Tax=Hirundo rustica rustica TaxID=333673 RepID=A0A3M0JP59_HIRRU|nr:hypothetical protein DUI87_19977 [Hirundo rustica rustica]
MRATGFETLSNASVTLGGTVVLPLSAFFRGPLEVQEQLAWNFSSSDCSGFDLFLVSHLEYIDLSWEILKDYSLPDDQFVSTVTIPLCFIASHLNVCVVSQWAVYAIRNLTEQNERNQALIAQMEQKGLADSSALERMGLEIQQRDDKLILRSARKKPS